MTHTLWPSHALSSDSETETTPETSRDALRSKRKRDVRARSVSVSRMSKISLEHGRLEYPEDTSKVRPKSRAECVNGIRPCPFVSCRHHLYLDVNPKNGNIKVNFPDLEVEEMAHSCSLDIADQGGMTLEQTATTLNITRERIRQVEVMLLAQLNLNAELKEQWGEPGETPTKVRRLPVIQDDDDLETEFEGTIVHIADWRTRNSLKVNQ